MFDTLYSQVGTAIAVVVVALAFLRGDPPERLGAGVFVLGLLASLLLQNDTQLYGPQWALFTIDVILLGAYAALAWKSRRSWPVWASGLQSLAVMSHVLTMIDGRPPSAAFYAVVNLSSYGILLALALGVHRAWREARAASRSTTLPAAG